ncbi:amidase [Bradyrhizobium sp. LHD-71]|uniref:amidase n=1 Tax=Bradyrhizobium sp. LHD-71 TaxID=3072141 RepID=UPI00280F0DDF|nr:amidase [Bradyrhizobium sp. LHD-71]MDQ8731633.1 amidase [Bradyrhizobium sp. LHD-71]
MTNLPFSSATELAAQIKSKKIGSEELLDLYLSRIEKHNPRVNAIIAMDIAGARRRAKAADAAIAKGEDWGPLHGLPVTIKDSFDLAGLPATWGVPELKDHRPAGNAFTVQRYLDAGAIAFGKTNVAAYLIGWATHNDIYGTTNNPWDLARSPGGSSGGAAAALAAGLTALEIGVDFGGGVRNVAHYCGIFGHSSTYGVTNWDGHVLPGIQHKPDFGVAGPLARSATDLKQALLLMAGPTPHDAVAWKLSLPPPRTTKPSELRVAVLLEDPNFPVDIEVQERIQAAADFFVKKGAKVSNRAWPAIDNAAAFRIFGGVMMAGLTVRAKHDEGFWTRLSHLRRRFAMLEDGEGKGAEKIFTHGDWIELDSQRQLLRQAWRAFFRDWDVLLCPTAPTVAVPHDPKHAWHERKVVVKGRSVSTADPTFWGAFTTVACLPSTVAPAGLAKSGLPVGVQIVGPEYGDLTCIEVARQLEQGFQAFVPPKGWA